MEARQTGVEGNLRDFLCGVGDENSLYYGILGTGIAGQTSQERKILCALFTVDGGVTSGKFGQLADHASEGEDDAQYRP